MTPLTSRRGSRAPLTLSGPLSTVRYAVNGVCFDMVRVPPGRFLDGERSARRELLVSRPFEIGVIPVTQALWRAVMGSSPSMFTGEDRPVERVSWDDVQHFMLILDRRGFPGFRLPTEAEWVWAARCGVSTRWAGADRVKSVAVADASQTEPVAGLSSAVVGAFDLSGNVCEWAVDWYGGYGQVSPGGVDVQGPASGSYRVIRGGSWGGDLQSARVADRGNGGPGSRYYYLGVRLLRTVS